MNETPKDIVEDTYDHIVGWYLDWVKGQPSPREKYTDKVLSIGPPCAGLRPGHPPSRACS